MPQHRLEHADTKEVIQVRRMSKETASYLNSERDDNYQWKPGLTRRGTGSAGSLTPVLKILDLEGFDDHTINSIQSWTNKSARSSQQERKKHKAIKHRFAKFMSGQDAETRRLVASFVGGQCRDMFVAGIKTGLAVSINGQSIDFGMAAPEDDFDG